MKLNYEILRTELAGRLHCDVSGINNESGLIQAPMLFEPDTALWSEYCYITDSLPPGDSSRDEKTLFILCGVVEDSALSGCKDSVLYFSTPQPTARVMNAVVEIFSKYAQWEKGLLETLHQSGSLSALLQLSIPIFNNPLILIDAGFYVLAYEAPASMPSFVHPNQKVDEVWILMGKAELIRARDAHEKPYFRQIPYDYPRLFINISEGAYFLGNLSIQASQCELRECDGYLLTYLAGIVRIALLRSVMADNQMRTLLETMLSEIIRGGTVDSEEFTRVTSSFRVTPGEQFRCMAIRIPLPSSKEYIRNFLHHLGTQIPTMYVPTDGETAALVLSATRAEMQGIDVVSFLEEKLKLFGFRVGLSDTYDNLLLLQQCFAQAQYALEKSEAAQEEKYVSQFSDYCLDFILENCVGNLKPAMLWKEGFKRLLDHDAKGRANYINTLRAYLDNNLNAQKTADALFISRNSLLSQIERINALLEDDLRDPKVRFRYELTLLLYDRAMN